MVRHLHVQFRMLSAALFALTLLAPRTAQAETFAARLPASAVYDVTISGTTYFGNTNFPHSDTRYTPQQDFTLRGVLFVLPTRDRSGVNFDNGVNVRDVGLKVGSPASAPQAGSVWFATNTTVFADMGVGNALQRYASLDTAFVTVNNAGNRIRITVDDQSVARTSQLNSFNVKSGLTANVYQILAGGMELRFSSSGSRVSGSLDFIGSGYMYPGSSRVKAKITGIKVR